MKPKTIAILVGSAVLSIILLVICATLVHFVTIDGDEMAVKETWSDGVINDTFGPKTYMLFPGFTQKLYPYKISQQVYVMNDDPNDVNDGRAKDSYTIQSSEGQSMTLGLAVQWRRDPNYLVYLHKTCGPAPGAVEEKILRPELMRIVKDKGTVKEALKAYSGEGLVQLQNDVQTALRDENGELRKRGIIVDNFVIQYIHLDPKYVEQIKEKQIAVQEKLKNDEQTKAAQAAALKAKAESQAGYERAVVQAEQEKQVGILAAQREAKRQVLAAEAANQQVILAAEAARQQVVLAAQGEKEAGELRAKGIVAVGNAEADVIKVKMLAYSGVGADNYVKMELARSLGVAFSGVKGWLPEKLSLNLLAQDYGKAINILMNPAVGPVKE